MAHLAVRPPPFETAYRAAVRFPARRTPELAAMAIRLGVPEDLIWRAPVRLRPKAVLAREIMHARGVVAR